MSPWRGRGYPGGDGGGWRWPPRETEGTGGELSRWGQRARLEAILGGWRWLAMAAPGGRKGLGKATPGTTTEGTGGGRPGGRRPPVNATSRPPPPPALDPPRLLGPSPSS